MRKLSYLLSVLVLLLSSCLKENLMTDENGAPNTEQGGGTVTERDGYHVLSLNIGQAKDDDDQSTTYVANKNDGMLSLNEHDVVMFTVDKNTDVIRDTTMMKRTSVDGVPFYQCLIPGNIHLSSVKFYVVANAKVNFDLSNVENTLFDDFKNRPFTREHDHNNNNNYGSPTIPAMNMEGAEYDASTQTIPVIKLTPTAVRIFLFTRDMSHDVDSIVLTNIAKKANLNTLYGKKFVDAEIFTMNDKDPQVDKNEGDIAWGNGWLYNYIVYPTDQNIQASIYIGGRKATVDLGKLEPGNSRTLNINDLDIKFDEGVVDKIFMYPGTSTNVSIKITPNHSNVTRVVEWKSSDESVLTVEQSSTYPQRATITAKKTGKAKLTASCQGFTVTCDVDVKAQTGTIHMIVYSDDSDDAYVYKSKYVQMKDGKTSEVELPHLDNYMDKRDFYFRQSGDYIFVSGPKERVGGSNGEMVVYKINTKDLKDITMVDLGVMREPPLYLSNKILLITKDKIFIGVDVDQPPVTSAPIGYLKIMDYQGKVIEKYDIPTSIYSDQNLIVPASRTNIADVCEAVNGEIYVSGAVLRKKLATDARPTTHTNYLWKYENNRNPFASDPEHIFEDDANMGVVVRTKMFGSDIYHLTIGHGWQFWKGKTMWTPKNYSDGGYMSSRDFVALDNRAYTSDKKASGQANRVMIFAPDEQEPQEIVYDTADKLDLYSNGKFLYRVQNYNYNGGWFARIYKGLNKDEPSMMSVEKSYVQGIIIEE